ncbi:MAG: hypothetical protein Q8L57_00545 [bacterium]|nr:hypothetical protein [bacterium]
MTLFNIYINIYLLIALGVLVGIPIHLLIGKGLRWLTSTIFGFDEEEAAEFFGVYEDLAIKAMKGFWPFYLIMVIFFGAGMFTCCGVIVLKKALKIWLKIIKIWLKIIKFCWE